MQIDWKNAGVTLIVVILSVCTGSLLGSGIKKNVVPTEVIKAYKDGECRFEGMECPNAQEYARHYQLQIYQLPAKDSVVVYAAGTEIGYYLTDLNHQDSALDSIIANNNDYEQHP